jgi:MFS family permease
MSAVEPLPAKGPITPSRQSLLGLSWLNFFLSGMQTAFGPIAAAYLAAQGWTAKDIGFALSVGGIASLASQVPGGELLDAVRAKRLLVGTCVVIVALSTLIFRLWPSFPLVAFAVLDRVLSLLPRTGWPCRVGGAAWTEPALRGRRRRCSYSHDGRRRVFRVALGHVRSSRSRRSGTLRIEPDSGRRDRFWTGFRGSTNPERRSRASRPPRGSFQQPPVVNLFRLRGPVSACQCIHAAARQWDARLRGQARGGAGYRSIDHCSADHCGFACALGWTAGRKTWSATLPVRAALFALTDNPLALVVIQVLDGITGAVLGVMTALVIADVTKGTGRFNLAQGMFGTLMGVGASLSPTLSGLIVHHFGYSIGFVSLAAEALIALAILAAFLPETRAEPPAFNSQAASGAG